MAATLCEAAGFLFLRSALTVIIPPPTYGKPSLLDFFLMGKSDIQYIGYITDPSGCPFCPFSDFTIN